MDIMRYGPKEINNIFYMLERSFGILYPNNNSDIYAL